MNNSNRLIFVYNANSGYMSSLIDGLHKSLKPSTYQCDLCALTYGSVSMKQDWKKFTQSLPIPVAFYHKNDFAAEYPNESAELPSVFLDADGKLTEQISAKDFAGFDDLKELMSAVSKAI